LHQTVGVLECLINPCQGCSIGAKQAASSSSSQRARAYRTSFRSPSVIGKRLRAGVRQ